jgi:radical SAM superfamily enzyme YgiQ (UPF0313 family)
MRILLITPRGERSFWTSNSIMSLVDKGCALLTLSMPTVAGLTPREHEVILCDENIEPVDFDAQADIVGVTGYIVHKQRMFEIIAEFRRRGRFVAVGGPYASLCPEVFRGHCDALFVGEAEETWPQFLVDFAAGRAQAEYCAAEKPDMTKAPMPRFDLAKLDRYQVATIQTSRGCPFRCEFCDIIVVYGRRPRVKTPDQVMSEIEECHRLGVSQIFICDDNFIGDKKGARELLRRMADWGRERGYPIAFSTEASVNLAEDDELLELVREANMTSIFFGIESPREASLTETKKSQNVRGDLISRIHKIQSYGVQVKAGMIVGFDSDDRAIFGEQLRFLQEARVPLAMVGMLQALPRTPLFDRLKAEGRLLSDKEWSYTHGFTNIAPKAMTQLELYRGYRELLAELYSVERYAERTRALLFEGMGDQVERRSNYRLADLGTTWRVLCELALRLPRDRAWFTVRLLIETAWRRPKAFREAGSLCVVFWAIGAWRDQLLVDIDRAIAAMERDEASRAA